MRDKILQIINRLEKHWNGDDYVEDYDYEAAVQQIQSELNISDDDIVYYNFFTDGRDEDLYEEFDLFHYKVYFKI